MEDLFERMEREMKDAMTEKEAPKEAFVVRLVVWVFAVCYAVVMIGGTVKLLTVWF